MKVAGEEIFVLSHSFNPEKYLVYAPLRSYLAQVPKQVGDIISAKQETPLKTSFIKYLQDRPLLDMSEVLTNLHNAIPELALAITDNCTLRCVYCHASAGETHKQSTMSPEIIDAVLNSYFNFIGSQDSVSISFNGGGEPTYIFPRLVYAVEKAKSIAKYKNMKISFSMATNGYYGDKIRKFIVDNFTTVSLSFDGSAFIHNRHRPLPNGEGSFHKVFETAKYFHHNKFPFAFRATVSSFSLPYIFEIIDLIAKEFPGKSIGLEHLNPFGRALQHNDPLVDAPDKEVFAHKIVDALKYAEDKNVRILNSASTEYDLLRPVFCSNVGIPNWTVSTNGDVFACGRDNAPDEFYFGSFNPKTKTIVLDDKKIAKLHRMNVLNYPECVDCFCKYQCAGDCPDRRLADKSNCNAIREIGRHVLTQKACS